MHHRPAGHYGKPASITKQLPPIVLLALAFVLAYSRETASAADAQHPNTTQPTTAISEPSLRLWEGDAPGALGSGDADIPTITPFLVPEEKASGAALIVCPGGSYAHLSPNDGAPVAGWVNGMGIQDFVLKSRLGPKYHHPCEMEDVQRAVRFVRAHADRWHIDPHRIGVLGFSAGGHLASTAATHFDDGIAGDLDPVNRVSCRPDLAVLAYPAITMVDPYAHTGSRRMLLGDNPSPALEKLLSNDQQVTAQTPPCFIVVAADDKAVPVENSFLFAMACREHGVPFELHVLEHGGHAFGLGLYWPTTAARWLRYHHFTKQ